MWGSTPACNQSNKIVDPKKNQKISELNVLFYTFYIKDLIYINQGLLICLRADTWLVVGLVFI